MNTIAEPNAAQSKPVCQVSFWSFLRFFIGSDLQAFGVLFSDLFSAALWIALGLAMPVFSNVDVLSGSEACAFVFA